MRQHSNLAKDPAEKVVKDIRRATRKQYSAEEKIRIVLEGLRGEDSIAELCRREGIAQNLYYRWSKDFLEAGKLTGSRAFGLSCRRAPGTRLWLARLRRHVRFCPMNWRELLVQPRNKLHRPDGAGRLAREVHRAP